MNTLYLECKMGAAGDMLMSALYDLISEEQKITFVNTMNTIFGNDVHIEPQTKTQCGISGTHIVVKVLDIEETDSHHEHHDNHHHHNHAHYSYQSVKSIIDGLDVTAEVKANAIQIYSIIGEAEAKVHNQTIENIHLHEVGSLDAMADVVGCCLLISYLAPENIICSPIHVGNGTVKCAHGILPVPAPATSEILKGIPYYTGNINSELCTPTGAAIIKHFANSFSEMPPMIIDGMGYGMGNKEFEVANMVRIFAGDYDNQAGNSDTILEISCNLDDMTGEDLGYAMELLLDAGALDVFFESIQMKKNRPGILLKCFCNTNEMDRFTDLILKHTTTRGVRYNEFKRSKLTSSFEEIATPLGTVVNKISYNDNVEKSKFEFEDIKRLAKENNLSLSDIRDIITKELL